MWTQIAWLIVAYLVTSALAPKPPSPDQPTLDDIDAPTADEGRPIPVVFGTVKVTGPNIIWYGDLKTKKIKSKGK